MERRKRSVATLSTLNLQIQSSIEAMKSIAPHLSDLLSYPADMILGLVDLEEKAVANKVISGLGVKRHDLDFPLDLIFIDRPVRANRPIKGI